MQGFLFALQFLTIIPIKARKAVDKYNGLSSATVYFPLIGLLLGLILAGVNTLLSLTPLERFLINVILVTLLIVLTGGLHLDGLADTFDALLSRKSRPQMLEIMRDSHLGTMGALSLICVVLIKVSLLCSLPSKVINISLILMCLLSRYSLVLAMSLFPYAREEGKAEVFVEGMNRKIFSLASIISLICVLGFLRLKGFILFMLVVLFVALLGKFFVKKIGGLTGDTLGATNELAEAFVLFNILLLSKI